MTLISFTVLAAFYNIFVFYQVLEKAQYILSICPEQGLSAQRYRCAECRTQIAFSKYNILGSCVNQVKINSIFFPIPVTA